MTYISSGDGVATPPAGALARSARTSTPAVFVSPDSSNGPIENIRRIRVFVNMLIISTG
ncbi:hypothetical protein ACOQFL_07255 [Actinopolyspora sp. H202]|uniref:hypothetical protein n=1 Tax=Actinopolyspora sp. H202 TaxID=1500456 RepID=UPI003EE7C5F6